MIHAELHSKCGGLSDQEDALTSTVFGILKYKCFQGLLYSFLSEARNFKTHERYDTSKIPQRHETCFWERIASDSEIDLLIRSKKYLLGIEIKYFAEESGSGQLDRYSKYVDDIIYITLDSAAPIVSRYNSSVYWLSWHVLHRLIRERLSVVRGLNREILIDLKQYLENREIRSFSGFTAKAAIPIFSDGLFWHGKYFYPKESPGNYTKPMFFKSEAINEESI